MSVRQNYHLVRAKARAHGHILVRTVPRKLLVYRAGHEKSEGSVSRVPGPEPGNHVLHNLELVPAFSLNFCSLAPRMRAATTVLPTTWGSEPVKVSFFFFFFCHFPVVAGWTHYRVKPTHPCPEACPH